MLADGLVSFVQNGKVKAHARLARRRSEIGAALVGREDDLGSFGASAQERRNLFDVRVRRDAEVIDLANKCIAVQIAHRSHRYKRITNLV